MAMRVSGLLLAVLVPGLAVGVVMVSLQSLVEEEPTYQDKTLSEWTAQLRNGSPERRLDAALALKALGPKARPALPALIAALGGPDSLVRHNVSATLVQIGPEAVPPLCQALKDKSSLLRSEAVSTLRKIGPPAREAGPTLSELLRSDADKYVRYDAIHALAAIDPDSEKTTIGLLTGLKDAEPFVRLAAGTQLWKLRQHPSASIVLSEMLRNSLGSDRQDALRRVGELGPSAHVLAPAILEVLTGPDAVTYASNACWALDEMGPAARAAIPSLAKLAADPKQQLNLRVPVVYTLGSLGEASIPVLIPLVKDPIPIVRSRAIMSLGRIGKASQVHAPLIIEALKDEDELVRQNAVRTLTQVDLPTARVSALLEPALADPTSRVRIETASLLWEVNQHPKALAPLMRELHNTDRLTRQDAVEALAAFGPAAKPAVPRLVEMLVEDKDEFLVKAVRKALKQIDPETAAAHGIP